MISKKEFDNKKFYDKYKGLLTCAYADDIKVDKDGKERCYAERTKNREKYLFKELTDDVVLIECPKDCLAIEYENEVSIKEGDKTIKKKVSKEQIQEWIKQTIENAKSHKIDYCIADHGGTSPWFYAFNFQNLVENNERECKKEIANLIVPKDAVPFLDKSNLGSTLIPIINRPHWKKKKYNGSVHQIVEGKTPDKHKNKIPDIALQRFFDNERPKLQKSPVNADSDINSIPISSVISTSGLKKRGKEYQGSNPWHGSSTGTNFMFNCDKNVFYCYRCASGGGVAKAIALEKGIIHSCDEDVSADDFKEVLRIAREEYGLKMPEKKSSTHSKIDDTKSEFVVWSPKWERYFVKIDEVAEHLIPIFNFKTIFGKKSEVVWRYNDKIYVPDGRQIIKSRVELLLGNHSKNNIVAEVFEKIKRMTDINREDFDKTDINLIPLLNGVYNIREKKLQEHDPKNNFKFIIPVEYKSDAQSEYFLKFIEEILYPDDIPVIQEWFGYCLYRGYPIKKAVIFFGDRDTGKTTLLQTLISFIGEKNTTGVSLQKLSSNNDFVKLSLKDKHLNANDDLPSQDLTNGGNFKVSTGDGHISAEEKFGDYIQFKNFAKHTYSANKIPPVKDNDDEAYFSRWMPIPFDNQIEDVDPFFKEKLSTPKELSFILNWALEGLVRLLKNGRFSYNKTPDEVKVIMEKSGDPLASFVTDVLVEKTGNKITKDVMYEVYSLYAKEENKPRLSKEQLGRRLEKYAIYLMSKVGTRGQGRFWENVDLNLTYKKKCRQITSNSTLSTLSKKPCLNIYMKNKKNNDKNDKKNNIPYKAIDMVSEKASKVLTKSDGNVYTINTFPKKVKRFYSDEAKMEGRAYIDD